MEIESLVAGAWMHCLCCVLAQALSSAHLQMATHGPEQQRVGEEEERANTLMVVDLRADYVCSGCDGMRCMRTAIVTDALHSQVRSQCPTARCSAKKAADGKQKRPLSAN